MRRALAAFALGFAAFAGALAAPRLPVMLDSQVVLERYSSQLLALDDPKALIFIYTVSQAGPRIIEQAHRIYRSGDLVRDETLAVNGLGLPLKPTRIARYRNRYAIRALAPRMTQYAFMFVRAERSENHFNYVYRAIPLGAIGNFVVEALTIDGRSYLPSLIRFRTSGIDASAIGAFSFAQSGRYWVPTGAAVQARVAGKPARERIAFGAYQFPASLPKSTFQIPKPLRASALPRP